MAWSDSRAQCWESFIFRVNDEEKKNNTQGTKKIEEEESERERERERGRAKLFDQK